MNYNELLFILNDTKNPSYFQKELRDRQNVTSKKGYQVENLPYKILNRVYEKYLKVDDKKWAEVVNTNKLATEAARKEKEKRLK